MANYTKLIKIQSQDSKCAHGKTGRQGAASGHRLRENRKNAFRTSDISLGNVMFPGKVREGMKCCVLETEWKREK